MRGRSPVSKQSWTNKIMTQAEKLTDMQITQTYKYFEHGEPKPRGVILNDSFTKTMGRVWDSELGRFVIL